MKILTLLVLVFSSHAGELRPILGTVTAVGLIYPFFEIPVPSKASGVIVEILHEVGERIQREDTLAVLENENQKTRLPKSSTPYLSRAKFPFTEPDFRQILVNSCR
jgi:multidrug efflux pump subunit AcrA (membrane-fusion protein)